MDENRNVNIEKNAVSSERCQTPPAYSQRRMEGASRDGAGAPAVVRRAVPAASQGQRPVSASRPAANGAASPQRPAGAPANNGVHRSASSTPRPVARPVQGANGVRPANADPTVRRPVSASPAAAQKPAPTPRPAASPSPAYNQRRVAEPAVPTPAPAPAPEKDKKAAKPAADAKKQKTNGGAAAEGASMMMGIVKAIIYMVIILVVSVFISIFTIRIGNDVFAFVKSDEAIDVTIPEEATPGDITEILADNGIINFPGIFKMYMSLKKDNGPFVAGDYTISPAMSYDELRRAFKKQVVTGTVWITIPEGYTTDEIIDLMVENGIGERDKYIDVINNYEFDYWFVKELENSQLREGRVYRLEGYLFPDTYEFYKASSEETVIARLLDRFNEVFVEDYKTKAEELGYTVDEILTIASLIEKEAGGAGDFMYVSSVFHNRLNNPTYYPRLESDATTVYAIQIATGKRPDKITPEDNKFDHPYNSYLNDGLTPGPITNPSASAIRYALYPAKTGYYYFITDNAGKVYYANGIGEHEQNIALVKKINEQMED